MSGHSKWAGIKHKKAIVDAKRGKIFTKVARELSIAAREGGPDPTGNFRLRLAMQKAREVNMPADNIERAVARGSGGKEGVQLEEIRYEGYGPHGVAVMVDVLTDNRNRTVASVRNLFTRAGGSLGETNSVAWMFKQQGIIRVEGGNSADDVALQLLETVDVGAEGDVSVEDDEVIVTVAPSQFESVVSAIQTTPYKVVASEVTMNPSTMVTVENKDAHSVLKLLDALEDDDDVQEVYTNADIPAEVLESVT